MTLAQLGTTTARGGAFEMRKHKKRDHLNGNDPTCAICKRHKAVSDLIEELDARHLCDIKGPDGGTLGFYSLPNSATIILQWYNEDSGFEIYRPVTMSNRVEDCFLELHSFAAEVAHV